MSATGKKSKKPSDASSERQHEEPVLFLDRSLGRHVIADALRAAGMKVQVHDDHLPNNAPDEDWIALVGQTGWVALTKDRNIRYRAAELDSVRRHAARIIVIRAKDMTGPEIAELLVKGRSSIAHIATIPAPLVAGIDRRGRVLRYENIWDSREPGQQF